MENKQFHLGCSVIGEEEDKELVYSLIPSVASEEPITSSIRLDTVISACNEYFNKVDGLATTHKSNSHRIRSDLVTAGSDLLYQILPEDIRLMMSNMSALSARMTTFGDIEGIPWEGLYFGDYVDGWFLGEKSLVSRIPTDTKPLVSTPKCIENHGLPTMVVEKEIIDKEEIATLSEISPVCCDDIDEFQDLINGKNIVFLLCNQNENGIKFNNNITFTKSDASVCKFAKDSVLLLVCCGDTGSVEERGIIASAIAYHCKCTVIASLSKLPLSSGVSLIQKVNNIILEKFPGFITVEEILIKLKNETDDLFHMSMTVYGPLKTKIRSE